MVYMVVYIMVEIIQNVQSFYFKFQRKIRNLHEIHKIGW